MQVKPNSSYLTKCGYVVELDHNQRGHCPALTKKGLSSKKMGGFYWYDNGGINGFDPEWTEKLHLVEEVNFKLPTEADLPSGYEFVEGMEFREPKLGDTFLNISGQNRFIQSVTTCPCDGYAVKSHYNGRRFILRPKAAGNVTVKIDDGEPFKAKLKEPMTTFTIKPPAWGFKLPESSNVFSLTPTYNYGSLASVNIDTEISANDWSGVFTSTKLEKVMSKNLGSYAWSATKFTGRLIKRAIAYQFIEPVKIVGAKILRTVRYVTLAAMLSGGTYTYYHPAEAVSFFKSLLPSISISFDKPDIMKG
jgi:hypothetical protein